MGHNFKWCGSLHYTFDYGNYLDINNREIPRMKRTVEHNAKIGKALRGKPKSNSHKLKISEMAKKAGECWEGEVTVRKKMKPYVGGKPVNFVLLWIEEDIGIKGTPRIQPYFFTPSEKDLDQLLKKKTQTKRRVR